MKSIGILLLLCYISISVQAQIEMGEPGNWQKIGEVKSLGTTLAKFEFKSSDTDTVYFLLMKDFKKHQEVNYFSIKFKSTGGACAQFYQLLKSFFTDDNRQDKSYMKTFKLGEEGVNLQHCTLIGRHGVRLTTRDGYINLSEKDIDKLFGKR